MGVWVKNMGTDLTLAGPLASPNSIIICVRACIGTLEDHQLDQEGCLLSVWALSNDWSHQAKLGINNQRSVIWVNWALIIKGWREIITRAVNEAALISGKKEGTRPTKYFQTKMEGCVREDAFIISSRWRTALRDNDWCCHRNFHLPHSMASFKWSRHKLGFHNVTYCCLHHLQCKTAY